MIKNLAVKFTVTCIFVHTTHKFYKGSNQSQMRAHMRQDEE